MSGEGSKLGGLVDDLVDGLFGAIAAPIDLAVTTLHGKPNLSSLDEGPQESHPSPAPSGPEHGH